MKRVPTSFQLGGHTFIVKLVSEDELNERAGAPAYGLFVPDELTIYLQKPTRRLKRSLVLQTFWHEFFHAMFWVANHQWTNEKLVDQCGHLLHQMLSTVKFRCCSSSSA